MVSRTERRTGFTAFCVGIGFGGGGGDGGVLSPFLFNLNKDNLL